MKLTKLTVNNYRALECISIEPGSLGNVVCGANGSGKTSLLEAIYIAGHGRSFQSRDPRSTIRDGGRAFDVFANFLDENANKTTVGVQRSKHQFEVKLNGQPVSALSQIAIRFPMLAMYPEGFYSFNTSARVRRKALDWGVFHVEPEFQAVSARYRRTLKQRNVLLKNGSTPQLDAWDRQLVSDGEAIDGWRRAYSERWEAQLAMLMPRFGLFEDVKISYKRGWPECRGLMESLLSHRERDLSCGNTRVGPHAADLALVVDGQNASACCSGGQLKLLNIMLRLAQVNVCQQQSGRSTIIIIDDALSELDERHSSTVIGLLTESSHQLFVSSIGLDGRLFSGEKWRSFHVEHGRLRPAAMSH